MTSNSTKHVYCFGNGIAEGKKEMKMRGQSSPDEADALCIAFTISDKLHRRDRKSNAAAMKDVFMR